MKLMDELIDAYLDNNFEHPYYLDLHTGQVILDLDEAYTGEPGIDWDDEENVISIFQRLIQMRHFM
ncbi:hypothetical protein D3C75_685420 [compost metagenome]